VIVIPGILGTELINPKTGETVWPSAFRTSQEGLPISPDLAANRDDLVPGKIIETVKLARVLPEVYVYRDLLEALRRYAAIAMATGKIPADGYQDTFLRLCLRLASGQRQQRARARQANRAVKDANCNVPI
jgi:hypothetical protein